MSWISFAISYGELRLRAQTRSDARPPGWRVCLHKHLVERRQNVGAGHARWRHIVVLAAAALVLVVGTASAFGTVRDLFLGTRVHSKIAFQSFRDGQCRRLRDEHQRERPAEADGQAERRSSGLVARRAEDRVCERRWRPWRGDNPDLYVMNADGSGLRRLTRDPAWRRLPCLVARRAEDRLHENSFHRRKAAGRGSPTSTSSTSTAAESGT